MTKSTVFKFSTMESARRHSVWIVLGDDGKYWVVTPADFERLTRAGYQAA